MIDGLTGYVLGIDSEAKETGCSAQSSVSAMREPEREAMEGRLAPMFRRKFGMTDGRSVSTTGQDQIAAAAIPSRPVPEPSLDISQLLNITLISCLLNTS